MTNKEKFLVWSIILAVFGFFLYEVSDILFPFITSVAFAYFLDPIVDRLEKKSVSRTMATGVIISIFYLVIILIFLILVPMIYDQIISFASKIPQYKLLVEEKTIPYVAIQIEKIDPSLVAKSKKMIADFSGNIFKYLINVLDNIWHSGVAIVNILSLVFLTPIITFYLLRDFGLMVDGLENYLPMKYKDDINLILSRIDKTLSNYIRGQTNVCLIMCVYYILSLSLLGLDFSLFIGIATGVLIFIPYIGLISGFFMAFLAGIFQFDGYSKLIILGVIFIIGQVVESNMISPKLVGDRIGLHPVWMIFAMMAGGALFGLFGVIFAIPMAAIIGVLVRFILDKYTSSSLYRQ
jgi:predicted PurR-regulated permease PerM